MTNLKIMPDLPIELVRYNNDNPCQIIFDERYFIKKLSINDCNIETLTSICNLNIEGFNNHRKILIDESEQYLYLIAIYLKEYKDTYNSISTMSLKDIVTLFKIMLERLIPAHQNDFIPYDIKYSNYILDKDNKPVFTDFDFSFYQGKSTLIESIPNLDCSKNNLILHDKIEVLKLFLQSISSSFDLDSFLKNGSYNLYDFLAYFYTNLKAKYILPQEVDEYLNDLIFKKMLPEEDDYFIKHLINPLEKGLELK